MVKFNMEDDDQYSDAINTSKKEESKILSDDSNKMNDIS